MNKKFNDSKILKIGRKIRYEANKSIMEKIDETISAIEKGKIDRCQEKLAEVKKIILK